MAEAAPDAVFMHCLPAHRGEEVSADVIDGPHSVVLDEAENRMHTAQALLIALTLRLTRRGRAGRAGVDLMLVVIALGGNALLRRGRAHGRRRPTGERQGGGRGHRRGRPRPPRSCSPTATAPRSGSWPSRTRPTPTSSGYPLDVLDAETEGMVGYLLEQELGRHLPADRLATLLTQIVVDPDDPAFANPTKFVGPVYDGDATPRFMAHERGWAIAPDGDQWRRVVPSPEPATHRRARHHPDCSSTMASPSPAPAAAGSPSSPTVAADSAGVEAVIDKDLVGRAARQRAATPTPSSCSPTSTACTTDWGTPHQRAHPGDHARRSCGRSTSRRARWGPRSTRSAGSSRPEVRWGRSAASARPP